MRATDFRAAALTDVAAVEALLAAQGLPTDGVATLIAADGTSFLLAVVGDAVVAAAGLEPCARDVLLRSVVVHTEWQGRGLGVALVERALAHAASRDIDSVYLLTTTAERFFPRFGFARVPREDVPAAVAATAEFSTICPASAIVMRRSR